MRSSSRSSADDQRPRPAVDLHNLVEFPHVQEVRLVGRRGGRFPSTTRSHTEQLYGLTLACAVGGIHRRGFTDVAKSASPSRYANMQPVAQAVADLPRSTRGRRKALGRSRRRRRSREAARPDQRRSDRGLCESFAKLAVADAHHRRRFELSARPPMLRMYAAAFQPQAEDRARRPPYRCSEQLKLRPHIARLFGRRST